ncbi:ABC transporter substrate-binding protein [Rhodoblastus sphagnicola]|uniref:ABC transporter substrate-binding protein n=1 Tax=Rhodoblastus sphagnicola TaxID=333368 RepID=A0A2S6N2H9_9HYPH|nr:extracellular solute-binding protein [Rhodoblastus sphagnicola]MBB4199439.1 peptide/nickel transport system substrate-binding protein [Rhodoblastus sphagnicola]PPQ28831.1 ABC transporter substrate-binding protein [Rhodoblastus sphagnicola]
MPRFSPAIFALLCACCFAGPGFQARAREDGARITHAIAMHGPPALPADFEAFPYADAGAKTGGVLKLGAVGAFDNLNPYGVNAGSTAQGLIGPVYESLMARNFDEPFSLYGLVAESIETDDARDFVTFRLDPRAHFSDGVAITAADVVFSFNLLKQHGRPQTRAAYELVAAVTTPDARTARFDLTGADDRELPLILALMPVLPAHALSEKAFSDNGLAVPLGSGPYKVLEVKPGEKLVLGRDPDYWGRDLPATRGFYNFDRVEFLYSRDDNSLFEAFKAGLIDYHEESDPHRWARAYEFRARTRGDVLVEALPVGGPKGLEGLVFNTRRENFGDPRLREALAMMFDFEWINANLFDGLFTRTKSFFDESDLSASGRPADAEERALLSPFPDAVREDVMEGRWAPPVSDGSGRDRDIARRALKLARQAGWRMVDGALRKDGRAFAFEIMTQSRDQERIALTYAGQLRRIGVEARVRLVDEVQFQRRRQKFDFDMTFALWQASASPGNEQRNRWSAEAAGREGSYNFAGAREPAVDAMIAALVGATSRERFVVAARALDRVLLSGFYAVPLFHRDRQWVAYWRRIGRPDGLPRFAQPLFGEALESWSLR